MGYVLGMRNSRWRKWGALFALLIALACVPRARKLSSPDFKVFYVAARHVLESPANLYRISPDRYLYPPSAAILLTPFAFTDHYPLHQWIWHGFLAALLGWLAGFSGAALLAMVLLSRYLAINFGYGQINLVVLALLAAAGESLRRSPGRAGAWWALAVMLKVYPAVLAPAFLRRDRWRGWLGALAMGLLLLLLPFFVFGPSLGWQLYGEFFHALADKGFPSISHNQSFAALAHRLLGGQPFLLHGVGEVDWSLAAWAPGRLAALAWLTGGVLTAATWMRAWRAGRGVDTCLSAAAFSVIFLSHIVWKDYLMLLYFPLRELFGLVSRRAAIALAVAFALLVGLSSPDVLGAPVASRLDAASIHLWGAVLVWVAWLKCTR